MIKTDHWISFFLDPASRNKIDKCTSLFTQDSMQKSVEQMVFKELKSLKNPIIPKGNHQN